MKTLLRLSVSVAAVCAVAPAYAQDISAELRGQITSQGAAVAGAKVTIVHVPSGTTTVTTTMATPKHYVSATIKKTTATNTA